MSKAAAHKPTPQIVRGGQRNFEESNSARRNFLVYAANMSWQLAVVVVVPIAGGAWLDKKYGAGNLWVFVGLAVALVASTLVVWRVVKLADRLPVPKLTAAQKRAVRKSYEEDDEDDD